MMRSFVRACAVGVAALTVSLSCGSEPTEPPAPTQAVAVSGGGQTGTVGQPLPAPLVVQVNDQFGEPMAGVPVTFAVTTGSGSVSGGGSTGSNGQVSGTWTLGTAAGTDHRVTATVPGSSLSVMFSARATAGTPAVITAVGGNSQVAFRGTKLPGLLVVLVRDQYANGVAGQLVTFAVAMGGGSVDSSGAFTDQSGRARTGWTLGSAVGENRVEATLQGVTGSPVLFTATAHNLSVNSVSPTPLVLGQGATIQGTGFDPTPANNTVTIGGETATVTNASDTQLDVTVPDACLPAGLTEVVVAAGGFTSAPANANLAPTQFLTMTPGTQQIIQDPTAFCLQFEATAAAESYLIGIQAVTEVASSRTPVTLRSVIAAGAAPAPSMLVPAPASATPLTLDPRSLRRMQLLRRHRLAESRMLERSLRDFDAALRGLQRVGAISNVPPDTVVGDTLVLRVTSTSSLQCAAFTEITGVVRAAGVRSVWVEDVDNPAGGLTASNFQSYSDKLDTLIHDTDVSYFGQPTDTDGNDRVVVVVSKEVNVLDGPAGFVSPLDFLARANCGASNEGEVMYIWAPDPTGAVGSPLDTDFVHDLMPIVAAHEYVHIIQVGRRLDAFAPLPTVWELEGQASLGEEVNGHAFLGNAVGQNLGNVPAFRIGLPLSEGWYWGSFLDLSGYYGADLTTLEKVSNAPEDCGWLSRDDFGACVFGSLVNGVSWSFLRWLSDQYGSTFAGGEQELHRRLIDNTRAGFDNIANAVSTPIETLMAQWAATLYLDDRVPNLDPRLTMSSWDLFDAFENTVFIDDNNNQVSPHLLEPRQRSFANFSDVLNVRPVSTAYVIVSGSGRAATAIRATDASGNPLPSFMQMWVVRMQ